MQATMPTIMLVTNPQGIPFTVRLISYGEAYGLNNCLTHESHEPMVEFYDARYPFSSLMGIKLGQFVSRYYLSALIRTLRARSGINLYGSEPAWTVSAENVFDLVTWATGEVLEVHTKAAA